MKKIKKYSDLYNIGQLKLSDFIRSPEVSLKIMEMLENKHTYKFIVAFFKVEFDMNFEVKAFAAAVQKYLINVKKDS